MNKIIYIAVALVFCLFASCKKQSLLTYDISDNIYFNYKVSGVITDSASVSFASRVATVRDSTFKLPLTVTGIAQDHDRSFKITVVDGETTAISGTHYVLPATFVLHAGRILDSLPVKLLRAADLANKTVILKLALQPGGDFTTNIKSLYSSIGGSINALTFKLNVSDVLTAGNYWTGSVMPYFGAFSVKKVRLINQITGMPLDYYLSAFLYDLQGSAKLAVYAITMSRYLADQKAAGHTIYEDDGITEMRMGANY